MLKATLQTAQDPIVDQPHVAGKGKLGIDVQPLTDKFAEQARLPAKTQGVVIKSIASDSAAAAVEELDEGAVIVKVNNTPTPNVQAFQAANKPIAVNPYSSDGRRSEYSPAPNNRYIARSPHRSCENPSSRASDDEKAMGASARACSRSARNSCHL